MVLAKKFLVLLVAKVAKFCNGMANNCFLVEMVFGFYPLPHMCEKPFMCGFFFAYTIVHILLN